MKQKIKRVLSAVALYIDDMLLIAAGACFTLSAYESAGRAAALAAAGACFAVYALLIARSRRGGAGR